MLPSVNIEKYNISKDFLAYVAQCGNYANLLEYFFDKKFRESNDLCKEVTKELI